MVGSMLHEPFYSSGTIVDEGLGAYAGWVCHAGSFSDCQPIWNDRHDIGLVFAGEHYWDRAKEASLRSSSHNSPAGDASCLVDLYEEQGTDFFRLLNGTFSGAIIDRRKSKVFLFNDRYGLGRIYWHENRNGFYFASEAKALMRLLPELRQLDMRGLGELLVCGCTLQNRTLFPAVSLLPPGSVWTITPGRPVDRAAFFDPTAWEAQTALQPEEYYEELKGCFNRILPRYFKGGQPIALSVTGGLDSRMIIAGAGAPPGRLPCYTFGGMYRDSEDVKIGRLVSNLCRQPHSVIRVDQNFFPQFTELAKKCVYVTDGTMDASASVGLYVNRLARDKALVRMTGNYGSEILRGNVAFKATTIETSAFSDPFLTYLEQAGNTYREESQDCRRLSFIAFKQVPWHHFARLSEEQSQLTIRAPYLDNDLVSLAYRAPNGLLLNKQLAYRYTTDVLPTLCGAPTDRGLLNRPPLLPAKFVEISMELLPRAEYYFDYGMPQWLAKVDSTLSAFHLERFFLGQQKYYHFRIWYRTVLAQQIKDILLDPRTLARPYLNGRYVEKIVLSHTRGSGNYTSEIHKLLSCEMIQRSLIERK
jgi:asparagine synthase (glutamine-hydrolysing)